ncbi:hypothetical protein GYMLUDRAFT_40422 [Collybiopsis luxurians FD-317 M1]|uniref:Uncharacterized protein n=1 Tax=Collybiopsis luxurians FD-317 M1 TaxID=944289 RepID=A0A0D0CWF0_9AGAR|nr:hypothetical protein GYMLUDRAFT_40422 [Collybiopsis luxurians FD-317 M1]
MQNISPEPSLLSVEPGVGIGSHKGKGKAKATLQDADSQAKLSNLINSPVSSHIIPDTVESRAWPGDQKNPEGFHHSPLQRGPEYAEGGQS